ncbi:hypothetical protein ACFQY4_23825 [Catellatospora bangladeshensis]|uniref:hypothetical protein n=1 Tax=Catellatospora bangladeshensis TaxID=310355 RepID=UPI0036211026
MGISTHRVTGAHPGRDELRRHAPGGGGQLRVGGVGPAAGLVGEVHPAVRMRLR